MFVLTGNIDRHCVLWNTEYATRGSTFSPDEAIEKAYNLIVGQIKMKYKDCDGICNFRMDLTNVINPQTGEIKYIALVYGNPFKYS